MGAFGLGVVQGFSTATKKQLDEHIERQNNRFDDRMKFLLQDATSKRTIYDKDKREAGKALKAMYGLTGDWNDAQVAIEALGGVSKDGGNITTFIQDYQNALKENPNLKVQDVLNYTGEQQGNMTQTQAMSNMATPFSYELPAIDPKQQDQGFLSSLGFKGFRQNSQQRIMQEMKARGYNPTRAGGKAAGQAMQARAGDRQVQIQWGALGKKEQQAARLQEAQIGGAESQLKITQDKVKNLSEANNRIIEAHQVSMQDKRSSMEERSKRLRIFEQENTPEMVKLNRRFTIAKTIKAESGTDAEEQWNLLDSQERDYRRQIREAATDAGSMPTGRKVQEWQDQIKDIKVSKEELMPTIAAATTDRFSKINVVSFATSIKNDAIRDAGLKYELDRDGRFRILKGGTADKIYQASRNAYNNFRKAFEDSNAPQVLQQREAMKQSMYNAQSTYVTNNVNKHFKEVGRGKTTHDTIPKAFKPGKLVDGVWKDGKTDYATLQKLKPGTVVLMNSRYALNQNWERYRETGNFGVWTGKGIIQRKRLSNETNRPTYFGQRPAQNKFFQ
jgi:hypothetical protein